ncbi:Protein DETOXIFICATION (Multidrug and toxic compound extrusion protein) [Psidium guajava]|nr:Protein DETOXIFICATION (Multidrug and toxic compound extrusion protein) [Psidium guajava]
MEKLTGDGVRGSNELGPGNPRPAAFSVAVVTAISFAVAVVGGGACAPRGRSATPPQREPPFSISAHFLPSPSPLEWRPTREVVGCGRRAFVAYINIGWYDVIGIPLDLLLGFYFGLDAKRISGGVLAGAVMQTLILMRIAFRTDRSKEVEEAMKRLDKWKDKKEGVNRRGQNCVTGEGTWIELCSLLFLFSFVVWLVDNTHVELTKFEWGYLLWCTLFFSFTTN